MKYNDYYGKILNGSYTKKLKDRIIECIYAFKTYEACVNISISYIAAWHESNNNDIWYEFVSKRFLNLFDCSSQEIAKTFRDNVLYRSKYVFQDEDKKIEKEILTHDDLDAVREKLREETKKNGEVEAVYKIKIKNSELVWLKDHAIIETYDEDGICLSIGYLTIVTKEMEAEEKRRQAVNELEIAYKKLEETNQELEKAIELSNQMAIEAANAYMELNQLFNITADGMCVIDKNFNVSRINDPLLNLFGISVYDIFGKKCYEVISCGGLCNTTNCPLVRILKGESKVEIDIEKEREDKKKIPFILTVTAFHNPDGNLHGILANFKDLSFRKEAEQRRIHSERLQGVIEMAGAVCHELNQPMQSLLGYAELLGMIISREPNPNKDYIEKINRIKEQIKRMSDITKKLMRITKYETRDYVSGMKIVDIDKSSGFTPL
ncbi:MAG: PAS domain-containing protein [Desulfobacterales bacterium]|nr:PAS domain-containing protein [Desulfobacterales bacterium]